MVDRSALRRAYRPDENVIVEQRLAEAELTASQGKEAAAIARSLAKSVRAHKPAGIDAFMAGTGGRAPHSSYASTGLRSKAGGSRR